MTKTNQPTKKELLETINNLEVRRHQDLDYINRFIYSINHNGFDRRFLHEMFRTDYNIDINKASRDIIYFIITNRNRWEKLK